MGKVFGSLLLLLAICVPSLPARNLLSLSPGCLTPPASPALAQDPPPVVPNRAPQDDETDVDEVVRVETSLVTVSATVMDRKGKYVSNLRQEDFHISENGVEQKIAYFEPVEKPFTVALLLDTSGSTTFRLEDIKKAALAFIDQLRPHDRVILVEFNDRIRLLVGPTSNREALRKAINLKPSDSGTFIYEVVEYVITQQLNDIQGRKAIVLFSDGVDNVSARSTYEDNIREIEESGVLVFPVQFDTFVMKDEVRALPDYGGDVSIKHTKIYPPGFNAGHYKRADAYLHEVAQKSGARFYHAGNLKNLSEAFSLIAEELRQQYSLGYYPRSPAQPGQRRQLNVSVAKRGLLVRARDSYTAAAPRR
jgi:Ca-activated chloride channel family protein